MGGTRCYFRQCHVSSSKFPGMHFFRFPFKDSDRYKKWREFSKMEKMLYFSEVRRSNISICARHFRIECFMNYKMDCLSKKAVPTITRLSTEQALDFELDIENGVLVNLGKPTLSHLIPPSNFQCPLSVENDKILIEKLNELKSDQYYANEDLTQHNNLLNLDKLEECVEVAIENNDKNVEKPIDILDTLQIGPPKLKRAREIDEEMPVSSTSLNNEKFKILNVTYCGRGDATIPESTVVLSSRSIRLESCEVVCDDLDFVDIDECPSTKELDNNEELIVTEEMFLNDGNEEREIQFLEENHSESPSNDSDITVMQVESNNTLSKLQNHVLGFQKTAEGFDKLQVRLSLLEAENKKLKRACQENEEMKTKILSLQLENNDIKNIYKDCRMLNFESQNYLVENKKLKERILPKKKDENEFKNLLETLETYKSKEQFACEIESEGSTNISEKRKLEEEIKGLKKQLQLKDVNSKEIKIKLINMENENDRISKEKSELEKAFKHIKSDLEIKKQEYNALQSNFDQLQQKYSSLEQRYYNLNILKQESIVTTSIKNNSSNINTSVATSNSLNKAQFYNGIKRYISATMATLLRMEMFGSSEREWKRDEQQVAIDILGLGETVYRYFTDEWRIRLPPLRDVHNWLSKPELIDDNEDL